jgi:SAM-dependent methyltransferase
VDAPLTDHARRNREAWNLEAANYVQSGRENWATGEPHWGMWRVPESQVHALPDVRGLDVIDLGCGTGYWCAWLARLGANPTGVDISERQLETARELQREHRVEFPLIHASAEAVPLGDGSFDLAFSEYGAAIWCEPGLWLAEAHRLLRPGGRLVFLCNSPLVMLCAPASDDPAVTELQRPQSALGRMQWPGDEGVDFHLPHGAMLRVLRETGFDVEAIHEILAPEGPDEVRYFVSRTWARQWPCEEIWVARRR